MVTMGTGAQRWSYKCIAMTMEQWRAPAEKLVLFHSWLMKRWREGGRKREGEGKEEREREKTHTHTFSSKLCVQ